MLIKLPLLCLFLKCFFCGVFACVPLKEDPNDFPTTTVPLKTFLLPQEDSISQRPNWFMAAIAGSRVFGYGLEHWLIINTNRVGFSGKTLFSEIKKSWKIGGMRQVNDGIGLGLARSLFWPIRLWIYDFVGTKTQGHGVPIKTTATATSMALFELVFLKPFEVALSWKASPYKTIGSSLKDIMNAKTLYKQPAFYLFNSFSSWAVYLGCDILYRTLFQNYFEREQLSVPQLLGVGTLTTFTSGVILAPQRLVLLWLQTPNIRPRIQTPKEAILQIVQKNDIRGVLCYVRAGSITYLPGNLLTAILLSWLDCPPLWLLDVFERETILAP